MEEEAVGRGGEGVEAERERGRERLKEYERTPSYKVSKKYDLNYIKKIK